MVISGGCALPHRARPAASYFFSTRVDLWGWATWRRAWKHNDRGMARWPERRDSEWLKKLGGGHDDFRRFWRGVFDAVSARRIDTWDYQWVYSVWLAAGLSIVPTRNLISNIGFGPDATHTKHRGASTGTLALEPMPFPLAHALSAKPDPRLERWLDCNVYRVGGPSLWRLTISRMLWRMNQVAQRVRWRVHQ
jgi:hypothetical protein